MSDNELLERKTVDSQEREEVLKKDIEMLKDSDCYFITCKIGDEGYSSANKVSDESQAIHLIKNTIKSAKNYLDMVLSGEIND